jgi:transposase
MPQKMPGNYGLNTSDDAAAAVTPRAVTAVGHSILTAAWHMLQTGELYRHLGSDYFTRQDPARLTKRLARQLGTLGHNVTIEPREVAA